MFQPYISIQDRMIGPPLPYTRPHAMLRPGLRLRRMVRESPESERLLLTHYTRKPQGTYHFPQYKRVLSG